MPHRNFRELEGKMSPKQIAARDAHVEDNKEQIRAIVERFAAYEDHWSRLALQEKIDCAKRKPVKDDVDDLRKRLQESEAAYEQLVEISNENARSMQAALSEVLELQQFQRDITKALDLVPMSPKEAVIAKAKALASSK